MEKDIESFYL